MQLLKNTQRAQVSRNFTGAITKVFSGPGKEQRFCNEVRVLLHLNKQACPFVPQLLSYNEQEFSITTSWAGEPVQRLSEQRIEELFDELQEFGVRHDDPALRNVLYSHSLGRFTLIDFEFAEILDSDSCDLFESMERRIEMTEKLIEAA